MSRGLSTRGEETFHWADRTIAVSASGFSADAVAHRQGEPQLEFHDSRSTDRLVWLIADSYRKLVNGTVIGI
jgi:hypothetical protein